VITYFARRLLGGVVTLFFAGLMIHTIVLYAPGGVNDLGRQLLEPPIERACCDITKDLPHFGLHKPWPIGYLAWLFDPAETETHHWQHFSEYNYYDIVHIIENYETVWLSDGTFWANVPTKLALTWGQFHIPGSGVLTGDFGRSWYVEYGTPVTELLGPSFPASMLLLVPLPACMVIVAVQRFRRPPVRGLPTLYPQSSRLLY
jgi:ABC-type dipeptide/oligopeptide/nickel transport system permease component